MLFLCGGCVRDHLLHKTPKDRDFVMVYKGTFNLGCTLVEQSGGRIFQAKEEFLTIRCRIDNEVIDLVRPRTEGEYSDGRRPDNVGKARNLQEDASRRDFTINSLYQRSNGKIIDFFGGQRDIKKKLIRCVGKPKERFKEDFLRILRCVRFSCQLGFTIDKKTLEAMVEYAPGLAKIVPDRIREELNKSLKADARLTCYYLDKLNLFSILKEKGLLFEVTQIVEEKKKVPTIQFESDMKKAKKNG